MKTKLERAIDDTRYILECLEKLREITRKSCKSCENWGCEWEDKELSGREIAEAVGTSKSTIWRLVSQRGVYELMAQQEMEIKGVTE